MKKKKSKFMGKYLKIPLNETLNVSNYILIKIMEKVAFHNGSKKTIKYFTKKFNCTSNSIKNMTKMNLHSIIPAFLDYKNYPEKDHYYNIRKIDKENYPIIIKSLIEEYRNIISDDKEKNIFLNYINKWNLNPSSYLQVLCHQFFWGFDKIKADENTANRINHIDNAEDVCNDIYAKLTDKEINISL